MLDIKYSSLSTLPSIWRSPADEPFFLLYCRLHNVPIIHLTRRNSLEIFVSGQLADANKVWHTVDREAIRVTQAYIPVTSLLSFLRSSDEHERLMRRWLEGYPRLVEVDYADMFEDGDVRQAVMDTISETLEIGEFSDRRPVLIKQAPRHVRDAIINLDEVFAALKGTQYEWMLD